MNIKLLEEVKRHILEEPRRYDQGTFVEKVKGDQAPACGTVCCIAGWAHILGNKLDARLLSREELLAIAPSSAQDLLGIDSDQADRLFAGGPRFDDIDEDDEEAMQEGWPPDLWLAYEHAETPLERARVAAERIDRFIKTKGAE